LPEIWLNIPQAVVLEATGDLERARSLEGHDPLLLVIGAAYLLPPLAIASLPPGAGKAETLYTFRKLLGDMGSRTAGGCYDNALRRVRGKLINGVTTKGSRAPNLPVEVVDNAEFTRLDLRGIDVVDPRTGKTVWCGLLISANELMSGNGGDPLPSELHPQPPKTYGVHHAGGGSQPGLSTTRTPPLSDRELRSWYEKRVSELVARNEAASGEADWAAVKQKFSGRVTRSRLRNVRGQFAPADWKKQGRRSPANAK
jgi:hypothetical protein